MTKKEANRLMREANKEFLESRKPKFKHDCSICVFLGTSREPMRLTKNGEVPGRIYDMYVHKGRVETTVVARYSDEPSDYGSGLGIRSSTMLYVALMAVRQGYLTRRDIQKHFHDPRERY